MPICHSAHFCWIYLYSSRGYNEAQELDSIGMKHTKTEVMSGSGYRFLIVMSFSGL